VQVHLAEESAERRLTAEAHRNVVDEHPVMVVLHSLPPFSVVRRKCTALLAGTMTAQNITVAKARISLIIQVYQVECQQCEEVRQGQVHPE